MSCKFRILLRSYSPDTFERPIYAGNAIETVQSSDSKKVITIRTAGFSAVEEGGSAPIENISESGSNESVNI